MLKVNDIRYNFVIPKHDNDKIPFSSGRIEGYTNDILNVFRGFSLFDSQGSWMRTERYDDNNIVLTIDSQSLFFQAQFYILKQLLNKMCAEFKQEAIYFNYFFINGYLVFSDSAKKDDAKGGVYDFKDDDYIFVLNKDKIEQILNNINEIDKITQESLVVYNVRKEIVDKYGLIEAFNLGKLTEQIEKVHYIS